MLKSNLPLKYLENLEPKVFVQVFVPLGNIFQPKKAQIKVVQKLITLVMKKCFVVVEAKMVRIFYKFIFF